MSETTEEPSTAKPKRDLQWIGAGVIMLGLGSLGPANVYLAFTDPHYFDKFTGWRVLILPFGVWLLTGFLVQGLTAVWAGGLRRDPDWSKQSERAWEWWCKLGWWLLGICIALVLAALFFSGVASFLSTLDKGTVLIAGLLFMILLALWRIGDQMKRH
jgi:hypothetical protein